MESETKELKKKTKFVSGKDHSEECLFCTYATIGPNYVNCEIANGSQNGHPTMDSSHGIVIKPRKNNSCDYFVTGRPNRISP